MLHDGIRSQRIIILLVLFVGIALSVHLAKVALNHLANPAAYIKPLEEGLEKSTGVKAHIGNIQWTTWGGLGLEISNLKIDTGQENFEMRRIVAIFNLSALFRKRLEIERITVSHAKIDVILDEEILIFALIQHAVRFLYTELMEVGSFTIGTSIKKIALNDIETTIHKPHSPGPKTVHTILKEFSFNIEKSNALQTNLIMDVNQTGKISTQLQFSNIDIPRFQKTIIHQFPDNFSLKNFLSGVEVKGEVLLDAIPVAQLFNFLAEKPEPHAWESLTGKLSISGVNSFFYNGYLQVFSPGKKLLSKPLFKGVLEGNKLLLNDVSLPLNGTITHFAANIDFSRRNTIPLSVKLKELPLLKLPEKLRAKLENSSQLKPFLEGSLNDILFRSSFDRQPYIRFSQLHKLNIGQIKENLLKRLSIEHGVIISDGILVELQKTALSLSEEKIAGEATAHITHITFLKKEDKKKRKETVLFSPPLLLPLHFSVDQKKNEISATSKAVIKKGKVSFNGHDRTILHGELQTGFSFSHKGKKENLSLQLTLHNIRYNESLLSEVSLSYLKKRKFSQLQVRSLKGDIDLTDVRALSQFASVELPASLQQATGKASFDLRKNSRTNLLAGSFNVANIRIPYRDEILETEGFLQLEAEGDMGIRNNMKSFSYARLNSLSVTDRFNNSLHITGRLNRSAGNLFADLLIKGKLDTPAAQKVYESFTGKNFFTGAGLSGFYGISGIAELTGNIKGNITDDAAGSAFSIKLHKLSLLDSDNGNLWHDMTGEVLIRADKTTLLKNIRYICNTSSYIVSSGKVRRSAADGKSYHRVKGYALINFKEYNDDFKLFSRSISPFDIIHKKGKVRFNFALKETKEKTFLNLSFNLTHADFNFWKNIHKKKGEKLKVTFKGSSLNKESTYYLQLKTCKIQLGDDTFLLKDSEFFDRGVFDMHLGTSQAHLKTILTLLDIQNSKTFSVDGKISGSLHLKNFGNRLVMSGASEISEITASYKKNSFHIPVITMTCEEQLCTSAPFSMLANKEALEISQAKVSLLGKGFNKHTLRLALSGNNVDFDKIFGADTYAQWYKQTIKPVRKLNKETAPLATAPPENCLYCGENTYQLALDAKKITYNGKEFTNYHSLLETQHGILSLKELQVQYGEGSFHIKGRYNALNKQTLSLTGKVEKMDLTIVNSFIPDLDFFISGNADIDFYMTSALSAKSIYDHADGQLAFHFSSGEVDKIKWFRKVNYPLSATEKRNLKGRSKWKFLSVEGNAVLLKKNIDIHSLLIKGEDLTITATGDFGVTSKEIQLKLAAYPLASMKSIPLVGTYIANIVRYYLVSGRLGNVKTDVIPSENLPDSLKKKLKDLANKEDIL